MNPAPVEFSVFQAVVEFVKTVGFPIAVAFYFMLRTDKKLEACTAAITALTAELAELKDVLNRKPA